MSIAEDRQNNIYIGTQSGGLFRYDNLSISQFTTGDGLSSMNIQSILNDREGNLWLNHVTSLGKYNGNSFTSYNGFIRKQLKLSNEIHCLFEDNQENIWVGTWGKGIKIFDGESFEDIRIPIRNPGIFHDPAQQGFVTCIIQDHKGNIWYGTFGKGLIRLKDSIAMQYDRDAKALNLDVQSLFEDNSGVIWIGTREKGLCRFDGKSFTIFNSDHGLCDNTVNSLMGDHSGNIWVGTPKGLSLIIPGKNEEYIINTFDTEDGLRNLNFIENAVCLESLNRLWWGTGEIVTMLDLNTFSL